ncbi:MAG: hypothetical protein IIC64_13165 [SAR324 cluster bacterium]|nr:hypothetical protein [SAR324 cluster bacterium]
MLDMSQVAIRKGAKGHCIGFTTVIRQTACLKIFKTLILGRPKLRGLFDKGLRGSKLILASQEGHDVEVSVFPRSRYVAGSKASQENSTPQPCREAEADVPYPTPFQQVFSVCHIIVLTFPFHGFSVAQCMTDQY